MSEEQRIIQSWVCWPNGSVLYFPLPCLYVTEKIEKRKSLIHYKHFLLLNLQFNLPILSLLQWESFFTVNRVNCFLFRHVSLYCPVLIFVRCHFILFTHSIILTGRWGKMFGGWARLGWVFLFPSCSFRIVNLFFLLFFLFCMCGYQAFTILLFASL